MLSCIWNKSYHVQDLEKNPEDSPVAFLVDKKPLGFKKKKKSKQLAWVAFYTYTVISGKNSRG